MRFRSIRALTAAIVTLACAGMMAGCGGSARGPAGPAHRVTTRPAPARAAQVDAGKDPCDSEKGPCLTTPDGMAAASQAAADLPRVTKGKDPAPPVVRAGKRLWANSFLFAEAPKLVVEKWLTAKPETKGKYVLLEFWATWCPPCRRSIPLLNTFHAKYKDELVVIGISDETEADVLKLKSPQIEYFSAIDTQARTKQAVGVWGIPHVLLIEPGGAVIWQGFPLLKDYELTEEIIEKILAIGRKIKKQQEKPQPAD